MNTDKQITNKTHVPAWGSEMRWCFCWQCGEGCYNCYWHKSGFWAMQTVAFSVESALNRHQEFLLFLSSSLYRLSDVDFHWARGANARGRTTRRGEALLRRLSPLSLRFSPCFTKWSTKLSFSSLSPLLLRVSYGLRSLESRVKYNAPECFEMFRSKTSIWLSVNEAPRFIFLSLVLCKDHSLNVFAEILSQNRQIILR